MSKPVKPKKPYPEFPLFAHAGGVWAKKIRGKLWYFGPWNDPDGALYRYLEEKDAIFAGRNPRISGNRPGVVTGVDVAYCVNYWLTRKNSRLADGDLSQRTFDDYLATGKRVVEFFGRTTVAETLQADDFAKLRASWPKWGPTTVRREIVQTRGIFRLCVEDAILKTEPNYGSGFRPPSKKTVRIARQQKVLEHGTQMLEADEIRNIYCTLDSPWKAMLLLGVNCGFGNTDISLLPKSAISGEWIAFPRGKTSVERKAWLWPETQQALQEAIESRPQPKSLELQNRVFVTKYGNEFVRANSKGTKVDSVATFFKKLLKDAGIARKGVGFYSLRRSFETIAAQTGQQVAVNCVMGHEEQGMSAVYRQFVSDDNIRAVCEHVRKWIFAILLILVYFCDLLCGMLRSLYSGGWHSGRHERNSDSEAAEKTPVVCDLADREWAVACV